MAMSAHYEKYGPMKAAKQFHKAVQLDPTYTRAIYYRGIAQAESGDYDAGMKDLTRAIELNPNFCDAYFIRGKMKYNLERFKDALKDLDKAIELKDVYARDINDPTLEFYHMRGKCYQKLKEYGNAIIDYTKHLELHPDHKETYVQRAEVYEKLKKYDEAINDLTVGMFVNNNIVDPTSNEYKKTMGNIYVKRAIVYQNRKKEGDDKKAKNDLLSALSCFDKQKNPREYAKASFLLNVMQEVK
jgi:tetratricopeptide (TPR) repeat protein